MTSVTTLIKQIKERELRVGIMTKKFKKREVEIENVISEVRALTAVKHKLQKEEITKLKELREREMTHSRFKRKKTVWDMILKSNKAKREEANTLVEQLQEAVFSNRITYCEDVRNFLDKYDLLLMSFGTGVERVPSVAIHRKIDERGSEKLLKNVASLEKILMDLRREAEYIENVNKLKAELIAEPNEGHLFTDLRSSLIEVRNKVKDVETKIAAMKEDIGKLLQQHKYQAPIQAHHSTSQDWMFSHSSTCSSSKNTNATFVMSQSEPSSSSCITSIETIDMDTENYNDVATSTSVPKERLFEEVDLILDKTITISKALDLPKIQAKELRSNQTTNLSSEAILKMKGFTPKIPSAALRNHVLTNAHLDVELTKILSRNYDQYQDSV